MSLAYAAVFAAPLSTTSTTCAERALLRLVWGTATFAVREVVEGCTLHQLAGNLIDQVGEDIELVRFINGRVHSRAESGDMQALGLGQKRTLALTSGFEVAIEGTRDEGSLLLPAATVALGFFSASLLGSFAVHFGLLGAATFGHNMSDAENEAFNREQLLRIQHILTANAEIEREKEITQGQSSSESPSGTDGTSAKGASGKMGLISAPARDTRYAVEGRHDNPNPQLRAQELREAGEFGMLGMLASYRPAGGPAADWAKPDAEGRDDRSAVGNMFGQTIGDAQGIGGLDLTGTGEGGNGRGEGIGVGNIGGLGNGPGHGGHGPGGDGIGGSRGFLAAGHTPKANWPHEGPPVARGGHLPAEIIQRTVRLNFGRFRSCYESGLRTNPGLRGRVTTRFVIDRTGAVSLTSDGGSDIGDASVVSCVVRAFGSLSFSAPEGGSVTVSYPLVFSAES